MLRELNTKPALPQRSNGDPGPWARQRCLPLNGALTAVPRRPAAHHGKGWGEVTEPAIRALVARGTPLILWGRHAHQPGSPPSTESAHPAPMSARRGFFGSLLFSRANDLPAPQCAASVDRYLS